MREFQWWVFLKLIVALALGWAVLGAFFYPDFLDYLGWSSWSIEAKFALLFGITAAALAFLALIAFAIASAFPKRRRPDVV